MEAGRLRELGNQYGLAADALIAGYKAWLVRGGSLVVHLLAEDAIDDRAIAEGLARLLSLPRVSDGLARNVDDRLWGVRPPSFWLEHAALPIRRPQDGSLMIGCVDPVADGVMPMLRAHLPEEWKPGILTGMQFAAAVESRTTEEWPIRVFELRRLRAAFEAQGVPEPAEMAQLLRLLFSGRLTLSTPTSGGKRASGSGGRDAERSVARAKKVDDAASVPGVALPAGRKSAKTPSATAAAGRIPSTVPRTSTGTIAPVTGRMPSLSGDFRGLVTPSRQLATFDPSGQTADVVARAVESIKAFEVDGDTKRNGLVESDDGPASGSEGISLRFSPLSELPLLLQSSFAMRTDLADAGREVLRLATRGIAECEQHQEDPLTEVLETLHLLFSTVAFFSVKERQLTLRALLSVLPFHRQSVGRSVVLEAGSGWSRVALEQQALVGTLPLDDGLRQLLPGEWGQAACAIPIVIQGRTVGVLVLDRQLAAGWPDMGTELVRMSRLLSEAMTKALVRLRAR